MGEKALVVGKDGPILIVKPVEGAEEKTKLGEGKKPVALTHYL
ncbi:MAG: hypothetical protein QXO32_01670 [Candidatus Bathyarchaeia archaeon]